MPQPFRYEFTQRFNQPARKAYEWCTNFTPDDQALMGEENATREVQRITKDTFILIDKFSNENKTTEKQKLVCLYPDRLMWTSTHLTGPAKHSQFIYEITSKNKTASSLRFTALHIAHELKESTDEAEIKQLAEKLKLSDSNCWKDLANEMEKELGHVHPK